MTGTGEQDLRELAAAYALGALGPDEARAFEALLARSPEAQREVAEYREVGALMALSVPGAAPAPDLKARVLARATAQRVAALPSPRRWGAWAALAASLVAVATLAVNQRNLRHDLAARDSTITSLQGMLSEREQRLAFREAELNAILDPGVSLTRLSSTGAPEPGIQFFWNHRTNMAIVHAFNLKQAEAKRVYQLWFIPKSGKPIPSVTFNAEPTGHAMVSQVSVPQDVELTAAAVTEEPEGGSPQPTSPVLMVGMLPPVKS